MPAFLRSSLILSLNSKFLSFLALSLNSIKISTTDFILLSSILDLFFSKPNTSKTNSLSLVFISFKSSPLTLAFSALTRFINLTISIL